MSELRGGGPRSSDETATTVSDEQVSLRLFITGATTRSVRAIQTVREFCEREFAGRYELEIVDVYQQPAIAEASRIIAVPTLVKLAPPPVRKLVGDLSDEQRVAAGLGLKLSARKLDASRG